MGDDLQLVINFVNECYGAYLKLKEIHWNTYSNTTHVRVDEATEGILSYIDKLMENTIGADAPNRPSLGYLNPIIPESSSRVEILVTLNRRANSLADRLQSPVSRGIINILDDFASELNSYQYFNTMQ